jgi:poly-D-alanine transfer protein DltD
MWMTNGKYTVETTPFLKNIWEREGFTLVDETVKEEVKEEIEELTWQELKTLAKEKGINTRGMKKDEVIEALK